MFVSELVGEHLPTVEGCEDLYAFAQEIRIGLMAGDYDICEQIVLGSGTRHLYELSQKSNEIIGISRPDFGRFGARSNVILNLGQDDKWILHNFTAQQVAIGWITTYALIPREAEQQYREKAPEETHEICGLGVVFAMDSPNPNERPYNTGDRFVLPVPLGKILYPENKSN